MTEELRIKELKEYHILDTLPEKEFNDIVEIASAICDVPVSLISFVDNERQWFKAKKGWDVKQTPRASAFCQHAIGNPKEVLVVENSLEDSRFIQNPLVTGDPNIRFYAGAPLETPSGNVLGTLCVLDNKPRTISKSQKKALKILAKKVMDLLEIRKLLKEQSNAIEGSAALLKKLSDQAPGVIYQLELSKEGKMKFPFISEGIKIVHPYLNPEELVETAEIAFDVVHPEDLPMVQETLYNAFKNQVMWDVEYRVISDKGEISYHWAKAKPEMKEDGTAVLYGTFQDITGKIDYMKTLENIIFDVSHVMRKPVATLLGLVNIMKEDISDKETIKEMVQLIESTSLEMDHYLHQLNVAYTERKLKSFGKKNPSNE